jgi:hypothetical protein
MQERHILKYHTIWKTFECIKFYFTWRSLNM